MKMSTNKNIENLFIMLVREWKSRCFIRGCPVVRSRLIVCVFAVLILILLLVEQFHKQIVFF